MSVDHSSTVSVIIPAYNHERFVAECIQSVLNQTYQDFEIIITDDGSSDHTVDVIQGFADARIKLFRHSTNMGACIAANNCLRNAHGKYVAVISSDDAWYPDKLSVQVKFLDEHPEIGVVFGLVDWIDEEGNLVTAAQLPYINVFNVKNRTRFEWLNHFFYWGNCLCHPSSLVRRDIYSEVGMFNPAFASLPDFDLWVRVCLKYDLMILDQKLIRFRRMLDQRNASGNTNTTNIRNRVEYKKILDHYLEITDPYEFLLVFPEALGYGEFSADALPYFLGRIAIDSNLDFRILWGLEIIYQLLQDEQQTQMLHDKFNFTYADFIRMTGTYDIYKISVNMPGQAHPIARPGTLKRLISTIKT